MTTFMFWLLLMAALAGFLALDLNLARFHYRSRRSRNVDNWLFLRWWVARGKIKLAMVGGIALIITLALRLQEYGLIIPEFWDRIHLSRRVQWALGGTVAAASFVLLDLFLAWHYYKDKAGAEAAGVRFYRWWIRKSARKFAVVGMISGLALGGTYVVHHYNLWQRTGETSGYLAGARQYYGQKKFREAILELRNALQKNPADFEAQLLLARSSWQLGNRTEAQAAYREALRVDPKQYGPHLELARLSLEMREPEAATTEARQALILSPKSPEPRLLLAQLYGAGGKRELALEQCREIIGAEFPAPELRRQLIALLLRLRAFGEALQAAEAGVKQNPQDEPLVYLQVEALDALGRFSQAEGVLRTLAQSSNSPEPYLILGDLRMRRGEYLAAMKEYEEALKRAPDHERAMNNIANLNAEHGFDMERSAALAARLYAKHPKDPVVADTLGWTFFRQGKIGAALPLLKQGVRGASGNPVHHYHLGAALLKGGNRDAGKRELEMALKIAGNFDGAAQARELLKRR